ncbi:hypothetical protein BGX23_001176 [Mortierella sp. AD031]|nr:hypothetical protein BGX23_001176 [Mortierella sp. AD031]
MTLSMTVAQLAYSPDGQHLISGSLGGGLSYWNTQSGAHDNRLDGITCQIYACSFSPDGKLIATSTEDSMLRLWDIRSGGCVEVYRSMIGRTFSIKWKQGPDYSIRVWRLVEIEGTYMLHLIWGTGFNELVLTGVTMDDIVGLSLANLELLKQRAVPIELDVLRRDESTDDSSDKEMDRPSDEEMDSSSDEDEDTDGLERSSDGWSNDE